MPWLGATAKLLGPRPSALGGLSSRASTVALMAVFLLLCIFTAFCSPVISVRSADCLRSSSWMAASESASEEQKPPSALRLLVEQVDDLKAIQTTQPSFVLSSEP